MVLGVFLATHSDMSFSFAGTCCVLAANVCFSCRGALLKSHRFRFRKVTKKKQKQKKMRNFVLTNIWFMKFKKIWTKNCTHSYVFFHVATVKKTVSVRTLFFWTCCLGTVIGEIQLLFFCADWSINFYFAFNLMKLYVIVGYKKVLYLLWLNPNQ